MRGHFTVAEQFVFQSAAAEDRAWSTPFSGQIESEENVYERVVKVGLDWQALDLGWASANCRMLRLEVLRQQRQVNPTDEERDLENSILVELGTLRRPFEDNADNKIDCNGVLIRMGEHCRFQPHFQLFIRAINAACRVKIVAVPA